ncbi:MAG: 50S ribosomal protein L32 [Proteobacteria bacterium]|jgi:large subunit ribosomal protein L32|nr:MAG: 50S ribosomal protein L32 [Pseudomonadota bacterium]|tara:strand:+ start:92 stop:274 length:183 start_codon:yes stop_codon:yes gene_type:complete
MAVPKKKISASRRGQRRSHDSISAANVVICKDTGEQRLSHHVCLKTGMYRGKQILKVKEA